MSEEQKYYLLPPGSEDQRGPYSLLELRAMWLRGEVNAGWLFATEGMGGWVSLGELKAKMFFEEKAKVSAAERPPALPEIEPNVRQTAGIGVFVMLVAGVIGLAWMARSIHPPKSGDDEKQNEYRLVTNSVSERLIAPASARFSSFEESSVDYGRVRGHVDSQNGFGAMVRMDFDAELHGDQLYRLVVTDRNGEVVTDYRAYQEQKLTDAGEPYFPKK